MSTVIDVHCHVSPVWYEPVETLVFQMQRHGVAHAVLTQILGQSDNAYLLECAALFQGRFSCMVAVDDTQPGAAEELRKLAAAGARGVRTRLAPADAGSSISRLWGVASEENMVVSCAGSVSGFLSSEFERALLEYPSLLVLGEHLGGLARPDSQITAATVEGVKALARFPNLCLKVPPLGQITRRPMRFPHTGCPLDLAAGQVIHEVLEAFGNDRLCWGSDFPLVSSREGYGNALAWSIELVSSLGPLAVRRIFADNAQRIFRIAHL
jgi:L-fuconolactonase